MTARPQDWRELAAEYALGLLTGDELVSARALLERDEAFRSEAARWSGRLAPLLDEIEPVPAPASTWTRIEERIGAQVQEEPVVQLRRSRSRWRTATLTITALAACLALADLAEMIRPAVPVMPSSAATASPMVAMLGDGEARTAAVASWDPGARQLVVAMPLGVPGDPRHAIQLWVVPKDGKPHSLGIMPRNKQTHMKLADTLARLLESGATLAISIEPAGGSPTAQPTGPVVASGALHEA